MDILPVGGTFAANVALSLAGVLTIPRQFGPIILIFHFLALSINSRSNFAPSVPVSLNPADITTTEFIPILPQGSIDSSIAFGGITITHKSILSLISVIAG